MKTFAPLLLGIAALTASSPGEAQTATEDSCSMVIVLNGKSEVVGPLSGLRVLNGPEQLPITVLPGGKLQAIACNRSTIVPDARDDRIPISLGVPLFLSRDTPEATVVLERFDAGYRVRLVDGSWTTDEQQQVIQMIQLFDLRIPKS